MDTKVSVIVPTYNGEAKIARTLRALSAQTFTNFELIVAIDGSNDQTKTVIHQFAEAFINLKIITQPNKGRAAIRNLGASVAQGELLIFIDDDIEIPPDNIYRHLIFHEKNHGATLVGNPLLNPQKTADDFQRYRSKRERAGGLGTSIEQIEFHNYRFTTANMSIQKSDLIDIGFFDEKLRDAEDFDLSIRLLLSGKRIFFDPGLNCIHHDFANLQQTINRQLQYYEWKMRLSEIHPEYQPLLATQFLWMKKQFMDQIKKGTFSNLPTWKKICSSKLFLFAPEYLRDAVYSAIIYVHSTLVIKERQNAKNP